MGTAYSGVTCPRQTGCSGVKCPRTTSSEVNGPGGHFTSRTVSSVTCTSISYNYMVHLRNLCTTIEGMLHVHQTNRKNTYVYHDLVQVVDKWPLNNFPPLVHGNKIE